MKRYSISLLTVLILLTSLIIGSSLIASAQDQFKITGMEEEMTVKVSELKELPAIEKDVTSVDSGGDEDDYSVKGALLSDLLESKGKSQDSLKAVRLIAGDGYSIELNEQILKNRQIILAYEIDGEPLYDKTKPVRVIIPEERAMYWIKNLVEVKVVDMVQTVEVNSLFFLETAISDLEKVDYTYYESEDKAVEIPALMEKLGLDTELRTVSMEASDGYKKEETTDIFEAGYIKVTGDHAPMFLSPDIPKGMYVKDLTFVGYGSGVIASLKQAVEVLPVITIEETEGVQLSELLKKTGLVEADKYSLEASDGYTVEVDAAEMEEGIAYIDDKDRVRALFSNLSSKYAVKYLYKIEPVK